MKKNKGCGCKTSENVKNTINKVNNSQEDNINKRNKTVGYILKSIFNITLLFLLIITVIPLFLYVIFSKKPVKIDISKIV